MSAIVVDECLFHLLQAEQLMEKVVEIPSFQEIFEAETPEVKNQIVENQKNTNGALAHLKKAAQAVLDMINKILSAFKDFVLKRQMSDEERTLFEQFKEACKKDPSLKNKKITVTDFRETEKQYNALMAEAEKVERELEADKDTNCDLLMNKMKEFMAGAAKGVAVAVTTDVAVNMASSSKDFAKLVYAGIKDKDSVLMKQIIEGIGQGNANKFKRDVKSLGKQISLKRLTMKMKHQVCQDFQQSYQQTFNNLKTVSGAFGMAKKLMGNEQIKSGTKEAVKIAADAAAMGAKMNREDKAAARKEAKKEAKIAKRRAKGDYSDQSIMDSLLGKNTGGNKFTDKVDKANDKIDNTVDKVKSKFTNKK